LSNQNISKTTPSQPVIYQIRIQGQLDSQWADWFEGMNIALEESGFTVLTGPVTDQSALHGLIRKIRDLGLPLVSVCPVGPDQADAPDTRLPNKIQ
jgi:hypothetical protein